MIDQTDFDLLADFLIDIDALKAVERRSYVLRGARLENSAEHSWHVAVAAWTIAKRAGVPVSVERVLKLALLHDLCELDAGDTFAHAADRRAQRRREGACVSRLEGAYGDLLDELRPLWREYEDGRTPESRLVRLADRLLPFLHNFANSGKTWREHGIARSQVLALNRDIERDFPKLFEWMQTRIAEAVAAGWLTDA